MRTFIFFTFFLVTFSQGSKEYYRLDGRVISEKNNEVIESAAVSVVKDNSVLMGTYTDFNGEFAFEKVPGGKIIIVVNYIGSNEIKKEVKLQSDESVEIVLTDIIHTASPVEIIGQSPRVHKRLPGTASRIDIEAVQAIKAVGTQELLEYVPGVVGFADDGAGNSRLSIGIRGLNPRRSSRVLVLEDGIPIQPAAYIYPNMYYNPPVERIETIEVIKGSASIEYGPQTMGGVINYVTKRPRTYFGHSLQLQKGTNNYNSLFYEIGGFGSTEVLPELQLLYKQGDGFRENNDFEQINGTVKLNIIPDENRHIYLKLNLNHEKSNATYTGLTEYTFETEPKFNPKKDDLFTVKRYALDMIYTSKMSSALTAETKVFTSYFNREWWRDQDIFIRPQDLGKENPSPVSLTDSQFGDLVRVGGRKNTLGILRNFVVLGAEHSYSYSHELFSMPSKLDIGGRLYWERFKDDKKLGDDVTVHKGVYYKVPDPNKPNEVKVVGQSHHYETMALALHLNQKIDFGKLNLRFGLRMESFEQERIDRLNGSRYRDNSMTVLLPGFGFNYEIGNNHIFGGVHRGFTPPSSGTLKVVGAAFDQSTADRGLDLKAEKSWNFELGFRSRNRWLSFEVSPFMLRIEDYVAAGRGTAFNNLGKVDTYGVEFQSSIDFSGIYSLLPTLDISYTFLRTKILSGRISSNVFNNDDLSIAGNELPYAPQHTLITGIRGKIGPFSYKFSSKYVSKVYTDFENIEETYNRGDTGPVLGFRIFDASVFYKFTNEFEIYAVGKNIFDKIYIGSRLHSNPGQPEPHLSSGILPGARRQIDIGINYTFK